MDIIYRHIEFITWILSIVTSLLSIITLLLSIVTSMLSHVHHRIVRPLGPPYICVRWWMYAYIFDGGCTQVANGGCTQVANGGCTYMCWMVDICA